ncbi:MAG TPA: hypothetical protein IAD14_09110 [Candidatus Coprousia avicola]|nr:hypothetical protein [Candidatus Coprousia avicola]
MSHAIAHISQSYQALPVSRKALCIAELVGAYLWPLFGIALALVLRWRRARRPYAFCALAGAVTAVAVFCGEYALMLVVS